MSLIAGARRSDDDILDIYMALQYSDNRIPWDLEADLDMGKYRASHTFCFAPVDLPMPDASANPSDMTSGMLEKLVLPSSHHRK
jgi:hypothetical protein